MGRIDMLAEGDAGYFEEELAGIVGIKEVNEALAFIFEVVAEFNLIHGVVLIALLTDGFAAVPVILAEIEGGRGEMTAQILPPTALANQVMQVCESGIGLYLELDGEVFYFGADGSDGV